MFLIRKLMTNNICYCSNTLIVNVGSVETAILLRIPNSGHNNNGKVAAKSKDLLKTKTFANMKHLGSSYWFCSNAFRLLIESLVWIYIPECDTILVSSNGCYVCFAMNLSRSDRSSLFVNRAMTLPFRSTTNFPSKFHLISLFPFTSLWMRYVNIGWISVPFLTLTLENMSNVTP